MQRFSGVDPGIEIVPEGVIINNLHGVDVLGVNHLLGLAKDFKAFQLRELSRNIDRLVTEYETRLAAEVRGAFEGAYYNGGMAVVEPLQELGLGGAFFQPNRAQVNVLLDFSADLVKNILAPGFVPIL